MDTGTGAVHIAPGHGEDDYWLGKQNNLPILSPVDDHGRLTDEAGLPNLTGEYVFDANGDIVNLLRERENLLGAQNLHHSYPYCRLPTMSILPSNWDCRKERPSATTRSMFGSTAAFRIKQCARFIRSCATQPTCI